MNPALQEPEHGVRHTPLRHFSPAWQMAIVPVAEHGSFGPEISDALQAQMPELPWGRHAAQLPGLAGLQLARHSPPTHGVPAVHGCELPHAWHTAAPTTGKHNSSAPPSRGRHAAGFPPTGAQVVAVQPEQPAAPLQQARHRAMLASFASSVQRLQGLQKFETSQRSPTPPVGVHVPPWHA